MDKLLLRPAEVADALGLCRSKVYDMVARGELPAVHIGTRVRVPADEVRKWVDRKRRQKPDAK